MKRVEIIVNQSIETDLFENFARYGVARRYTKIPGAHGVGNSDPKMGDHIWPEENVVLIIYCNAEEAELLEKGVQDTKKKFPAEGLKIFIM
ncbi:MAG: hypothetical protein PQJ50_02830 [Spirochaetales bacterium]|nr:hypothetical protein [Spirochaetales bacterium]